VSRILALDYGRRRIGVAVSDPLQSIALPYETWENSSIDHIVRMLLKIISSHQVGLLVVGFPVTMKGERKKLAKEVERFCEKIRKEIDLPIVLWDERMTSIQAKRAMIQMKEKPSRQKDKVDRIAATLLLQNYLDANAGPVNFKTGEID
jgi:putative Holliday junction resolvase